MSEQPNTTEIRYRLERGGATYIGKDTLALCDALDAARAERDEARRTRDDQYDRAEAAEANLAHVRSLNITAAAGSWNDAWAAMRDDRDHSADKARIAAVLARCKQGNRGGPYGLQDEITALLTEPLLP